MVKKVFIAALAVIVFSLNVNAVPTPHAGMQLIAAKGKTYQIGFSQSEWGNETIWSCIISKHNVTFTYDFYVDTTLVTQQDYYTIMKYNPSSNKTGGNMRLPVEQVTWYDAVLYCNERSKRDNLDTVYSYTAVTKNGNSVSNLAQLKFTAANLKKNGYRLLTNAEAEYCERAGTPGKYWWTTATNPPNSWNNDTVNTVALAYCVFSNNSNNQTQPVASKKPNPWGLYDMNGNLFIWENDWEGPYSTTDEVDPIGQPSCNASSNASLCGTYGSATDWKMARGGSYRDDVAGHGRTCYHFKWGIASQSGEVGFRCVATAPGVGTTLPAENWSEVPFLTIDINQFSTKIEYTLKQQDIITMALFDCQGNRVRSLVLGRQGAGVHSIVWDGKNDFGKKVGAGSYIIAVNLSGRSFTKAIVMTQ